MVCQHISGNTSKMLFYVVLFFLWKFEITMCILSTFVMKMITIFTCVCVVSTRVIVACRRARVWVRVSRVHYLCYRTSPCRLNPSVALTGTLTSSDSASAPPSTRHSEYSLSPNSKLSDYRGCQKIPGCCNGIYKVGHKVRHLTGSPTNWDCVSAYYSSSPNSTLSTTSGAR